MIIETDDEILGLEERRESFNICDMKRVYPAAITPYRQVMPIKSEPIFAYADGEIEISKEFLRKLVAFSTSQRTANCWRKGDAQPTRRPSVARTFISQPSLSRGPTIDMLRLVWKQSNLRAPVLPVWLCGTLIARNTAMISSSVRGVFTHEYQSDSRAGTDRQR
jgi:hypothetical protein